MKKRFVCAVLALMLLISLVPATALTASAASLSVSEGAITVLKQLEGYSQTCNAKGYIGYGTLCTASGTHGDHKINEKKADTALRAELKELDKAINNSGLSLTQSKHDALVLFSFQNGTAWLNGTGDLKAAVANRMTGSEFLNVICNWSATDSNSRRMIEANMYLYGVYSSSRPSKFISVTFDAGSGKMNGQSQVTYYYDLSANPVAHLEPVRNGYTFTGWYAPGEYEINKQQVAVTTLAARHNGKTLVAGWAPTSAIVDNAVAVDYLINKSQLLDEYLYVYQAGTLKDKTETYTDDAGKKHSVTYTVQDKEPGFALAQEDKKNIKASTQFCTDNDLRVDRDMLDENRTRWCRVMGTNYWVKVSNKGTAASSDKGNSIDLTVSVTNSYVNRRTEASIYSTKSGSYDLGAKLRIINTASADGFLWGQVAANTTGTEAVGWVALMYTDFETVRSQSGSANTNNGTVVATGFITYNGYVNVRSDAGTDNKIVGALPYGTEVNIYQTKFVNGLEWGRTDIGWFCMSYANVTRKSNTVDTTDAGYISYAFTGTIEIGTRIRETPNGGLIDTLEEISGTVTVTNLMRDSNGITWGKISQGWIQVSDPEGEILDVDLHTAKYNVVSELTVRTNPDAGADRVDVLTKGTEFNVNNSKQVIVVGDTIWGYADKVGEDNKTYGGWVNLASKYVSRGDAPTIEADPNQNLTGKVGTIVGADSVRVRGDSTLSGVLLGSIPRGTVVNVLGERNGWYMIDYKLSDDDSIDSWVYGQYIEVKDGTVSGGTGSTGSNTTVSTEGTGIGIIANTYSGVNVRASAGTGGALKGKILPGTQVNILETKTVGSTKWGRVEQGWICMNYVQIISDLPQDVLDALLGTNNGTAGSGSNSTTTGAEVAIYTGRVANGKSINVYKTTSRDSDIVRVLNDGDNVTLHEILEVVTTEESTAEGVGTSTTTTTKTTTYWARINDGYIMDPELNLSLDTLDEATYTVTGSDTLNVRDNAGVGMGNIVHKLTKGDQVKVTKLKIVAGNVWGYIESDGTDAKYETDEEGKTTEVESAWSGLGWISLAYTTKGAVAVKSENTTPAPTTPSEPVIGSTGNTGSTGFVNNTSGYKYTGKVINANSVNVRATASTTASVTTKLSNGASLVIYETTISENMAWGRCDAGWVYLYYVDLTPVNGAVDARVVYNDNTIAYTDVNCSEVAGTYARMSVIDIYEIVGRMARTDLGWVSTDNLL